MRLPQEGGQYAGTGKGEGRKERLKGERGVSRSLVEAKRITESSNRAPRPTLANPSLDISMSMTRAQKAINSEAYSEM